jgi:hypothetical protein
VGAEQSRTLVNVVRVGSEGTGAESSCRIQMEDCEEANRHLVCCLRPDRGDGRECTSDHEAEVPFNEVPIGLAAGEPEARSLCLPSRWRSEQAMVLRSSQMAHARVQPNRGEASRKRTTKPLQPLELHHERCIPGSTSRRERIQRPVHRPTGDDHAVDGALPIGRRLGPHPGHVGVRGRRTRVRETRLQLGMDERAMAANIPALREVPLANNHKGATC